MKYYLKNYIVLCLYLFFIQHVAFGWKSTLEILNDNGFKGEVHYVTTEDGYILENHRINGGENSTPVVLVSGVSITGSCWLMRGRNDSLAYLLADEGYDVWLINNRGTEYGMSHVNLTSDDSQFWKFSFHEMGIYDVPAVIEYIKKLTKQKVFYIGHSQGSTVGFIIGSKRPDIAKKIQLMIHIGPVAFVNHIKGLSHWFHTPFYYFIQFSRMFITINTFFGPNVVFEFLEKSLCTQFKLESYFCEFISGLNVGFDHKQFVPSIWNLLFASYGRGTSMNNILHFSQNIMSKKFREYDYGEKENMKIYNSTFPPDYNLTSIDVPTVFFVAKNDWTAIYSDAVKVYNMLANRKGFNIINYETFSHADFLYAKDIKKLLNNRIINLLNSYKNI